jgi:hypothetical protein
MIADLAVAHIATAGAVAAFLVSILVRVVRQKRTGHRHVETDKVRGDARLRRPLPQQALVDDPDITVPPLSGFNVEDGSGVHSVHHSTG